MNHYCVPRKKRRDPITKKCEKIFSEAIDNKDYEKDYEGTFSKSYVKNYDRVYVGDYTKTYDKDYSKDYARYGTALLQHIQKYILRVMTKHTQVIGLSHMRRIM